MATQSSHHASSWQLKTRKLVWNRMPILMGILNVTPDSFSDGGHYLKPSEALDHALKLEADGAGIIDIGGESTRPYSESVSLDEELRRTIPIIEAVSQTVQVPVSIDTSKAKVAELALQAGAELINDVTGLEGDPDMIRVARESGAGVCAMHIQGTVQDMQDNPTYENVVEEVFEYLESRRQKLRAAGLEAEKICLDPGIGFGKTHEHNWQLIRQVDRFLDTDCPILVGHSRKGFLANLLGNKEVERDSASLGVALYLAQAGVSIIRLHEVAAVSRALKAFLHCSPSPD